LSFRDKNEVAVDGLAQAQDSSLQNTGMVSKYLVTRDLDSLTDLVTVFMGCHD